MARDDQALLLQLSADVRGMQKAFDRAAGIVDDGSKRMERRAGLAVRTIEKSFGDIKLPKSLVRDFEDLGRSVGQGLANASRTAQFALGAISAYSIKLAADAGEIENAFDVAFKGASADARAFSNTLADTVGRDAVELRENMTRLQLVLTGAGVAAGTAAEMVKKLTTVGVDAGSLFNTSDAEALQKIISGLTGESEPLKAFGVIISEAAVKAELLRMGFKGNAQEASEAAKQVARANLIIAGLAVAQGDAAKTADSASNKAKAMRAEFNKAARELGEQLLPAFVDLAGAATDVLKAFNEMPDGFQVAGLAMLALIAAGGPIAGLLANLGKVIKLAKDTRTAIAAIGTANAAAGAGTAAGAAGGAAAGGAATGAGLAGGIAAGAIVGIPLAAGAIVLKEREYQAVLKNLRDASDAALDAALADARHGVESLKALDGGSAIKNPKGAAAFNLNKYQADVSALNEERLRRALLAGLPAGSAASAATTVAGGFSLTPDQKLPTGPGKPGKATKISPVDIFDPETLAIFEQLEFWRGVAAKGLTPVESFSPTGDFKPDLAELTEGLRDAEAETRDAIYYGIRGGLEAGFRDGVPGVVNYFKDALIGSILDSLALSVTNQIKGSTIGNGIASLFSFPGFANGTDNAPGGLSWVGERGRELVNLPKGAQVIPNDVLRSLSSMDLSGGRGGTVVQQFFPADFRGAITSEDLMRQFKSYADRTAASAGAKAFAGAMRAGPTRLQQFQERGR